MRVDMDKWNSLPDLVQRHRRGAPDAGRDLFNYYAQRLSRLAEQCISRRMGGRIEGDEVVSDKDKRVYRGGSYVSARKYLRPSCRGDHPPTEMRSGTIRLVRRIKTPAQTEID